MGGSSVLIILPLFLALGIGYVGYKLVTAETEPDEASTEDTSDPIEWLQKRYTRGELTEAEFEQQLERHLDDDSPA
ncbi:SHOCT domain-containing protein [Halohasta salina]|uniref:SHOCT domain-containing protein n=1 Tax=Halohasta salina TaxID=2961621 RepID=UPI0020A4052A|nr:SHOCT domain-containing protein [Halohasta salina]